MSTAHRQILRAALFGAAIALPASAVNAHERAPGPERSTERATGSKSTTAQSLGVAETASGGEIELSSVASSKAQSGVVQKLAESIINDHSEAGRRARELAEKLGIRVTPSATSNALQKEADDATARVEKATGPDFDRAYVEGTIRFHQKVLNAIDEVAPKSPDLKALFSDVRARVAQELDVARSTLASLTK